MNENFIRFGLSGDIGLESIYQKQLKQIIKNKIGLDFFISLGDNFYPNGVSSIYDTQWNDKLHSVFTNNIPIFGILGNHDYQQDPRTQIKYTEIQNQWKMPNFYYDLIIQNNIHLIFIDTILLGKDITTFLLDKESLYLYNNLWRDYNENQKLWLEKTLQNSKCKWKIVCGHYPLYSNGPHIISKDLQTYLIPLLEKYKIDIYFSGHDHNFQHISKNNINYIISGSFSYLSSCNLNNNNTKSIKNYPGYSIVTIINNMLCIDYINYKNEIIYSFSILKL